MIELEENKRKLVELKSRLEGVGESLWHYWFKKRNTRFA